MTAFVAKLIPELVKTVEAGRLRVDDGSVSNVLRVTTEVSTVMFARPPRIASLRRTSRTSFETLEGSSLVLSNLGEMLLFLGSRLCLLCMFFRLTLSFPGRPFVDGPSDNFSSLASDNPRSDRRPF